MPLCHYYDGRRGERTELGGGRIVVNVDAELVVQAVDGDRDAFTQLVRRHDQAMRSVAWRIVGRYHLVDDALQDAYVKAYCSIGSFRGDGVFQAWLRRIVANTCIDHLRQHERRQEEALTSELAHEPQTTTPDRITEADRLQRALRSLPTNQRVALVLVEVEGYSYEEAATLASTTIGNIGSRLTRARASLRAILETT